MRSIRSLGAVLVGTLALGACGGSSASRSEVAAAIMTTGVPNRFAAFESTAELLVESVDEWCATGDPDDVLDQADATRISWVSVLPFWFGPVMDRRSRFIVDPPVAIDDVSEILNSSGPVDANALRELYGTDQRGIGVVETLVDMANGDVPKPRVCEYAAASASLVAEEAVALSAAWAEAGPTFAADDEAANASIEAMVNESLFGIVNLENDPDVEVAKAKLAAIRWAILGDPTASVENVAGISDLLDDEIVDQLTAEFDAAAELDADALMNVELTINTNVVSSLGLSVQFSDADGDG